MGLGTEEEKKRNIIQDKDGLWWSSGDVDNIHAKVHELLIEKAKTVAEIFQCPFCTKKIEKEPMAQGREYRKIALIDTGKDESFVYLIDVETRRYVNRGTEKMPLNELISGLVSDCKGVDTVFANGDGMALAAFEMIRNNCQLRGIKSHPIPITWGYYKWLFREGR